MKFNNLTAQIKNTALFGFIMALAACQSDEQKLTQLDSDITSTEKQINSVYVHNEAVDSASRNPTLQFLGQWIDEDTPHIDSLIVRNNYLVDSIQTKRTVAIAKKYPLSKFLSQRECKEVCAQLRTFHSEWNNKHAANIIAGRGTLWDLYNVSFDLDYVTVEHPFYIETDMGYVRFNKPHLNKLCQQFEAEKSAMEKEDIEKQIRNKRIRREFADNVAEIERYQHVCDVNDSIYMAIEAHFAPQIQHRIDSLNKSKEALALKRTYLVQKMRAKDR